MREKSDCRQLGSSERDAHDHWRRIQYAKSLRRAGKALLAAEVALTTVEAFADEFQAQTIRGQRDKVGGVETLIRKLLGEQKP